MINVIQNEDVYEISFKYDPEVIAHVKNIPGRQWHPDSKIWTIPKDKLGFLINEFNGTQYEGTLNIKSDENLNVNATLDQTFVIPDIDISKIKFYVEEGSKPYAHQLDFMKFAVDRENHGNLSGFLLADEMGCITGDAKIYVSYKGRKSEKTLEQLYKHWQSHKEWQEFGYTVKCLSEHFGIFEYELVKDIVYSGCKPVYKITLKSGKFITLTEDHPVLTSKGYAEVKDLNINDSIMTHYVDNEIEVRYNIPFLYSDKLITKEYVGEQDVYDIKMHGPDHNFVANDIVVHNCGKTIEVANLAKYNKSKYHFKHCLIICCINSSKYNWQEDIRKHLQGSEDAYILGSRLRRNGTINCNTGSKEKYEDLVSGHMYGDKTKPPLPYFIIMNIEAVRYQVGKTHPIADQIIKYIQTGNLQMIAIDEIHKHCSPSALQGKEILKIKRATGKSAMWIPMTGTPITNKPTDVFLPLKLTDSHNYNSFYMWCQNFCVYGGYGGYEIIGYKNIPYLKTILQGNMLRRLKTDVLDLPPKIYYTEYVENTPYQQKLYESVNQEIMQNRDAIMNDLNPMAKLLKLRQVNGSPELVDNDLDTDDSEYIKQNAKLARLMELLKDATSRGEKVVVFSNWVEPLRTLYKFVSKEYKTCCFTGTMSAESREEHKHVFQTNPEYKVLLGTVGAAGTSHTFTAATTAIFFDEPWTPSDKMQAEDRLHRIGTTSSVNIITLITKDTVDERVHNILYTKQGISQYIVDNKIDLKKNPDLFDLLLGGKVLE